MKKVLVLLLLCSCTHLFFQPSKSTFFTPDQFKLKYSEINFFSAGGKELHAWLLPAEGKKPKGTILHFHGNAQNISTHFMNMAWVVKEGFNLLVFDYQGYGKSKGEASQAGAYQDGLAALDLAHKTWANMGKGAFIVIGQSLGGNIALRSIVDFPARTDVSLLVLDSTFLSYKSIAFDKLSGSWLFFIVSPLAYVVVSDAYASTKESLEKWQQPLLVMVGMKDQIVPPHFGKEIFKTSKSSKKWLWKIEEGTHIDGFHVEQGRYRSEFLQLVNQL